MIRKIVYWILKRLRIFSFYSLKKSGYLAEKGWFKSFKTLESINVNSQPIPWMTYCFIDFIEPKLSKELKVFEYGCGNSSLWWSKKVNSVMACEHDTNWFNKMTNKTNDIFSVINRSIENSAYAKSIEETNDTYDIVVIDGVDRVNCAKHSIERLKPSGVVIWDNSDREEYQEGYDFLIKQGFKRLDFSGLGPINVMAWSTSLFYKNDNCLGI